MQATQLPSSWTSWQERQERQGTWEGRSPRRRVRLSLAELAALRDLHHLNVDWTRLRPEITLYTPNQIRHLIRFDSTLTRGSGRQSLVYPTVPAAWLRDLPLPRDPAVTWQRPDLTNIMLEPRPPPPAAPRSSGVWEGAARGLPVGALLLALLVLLVRVAEKCLDKNFFKLRRRQSEEWPTPNVLATSLHLNDPDLGPRLEDEPFPSQPSSSDLPPPYSECSPKPPTTPHEEPPPPYSACYAAYNNPKDGIPSVHFYNRHRQELFSYEGHTSFNADDTGQNEAANGEANVDGNASGTELRFENGRVVERVVNDNSNDECNNANVEEVNSSNGDVQVNVTSSPRDRYLIV